MTTDDERLRELIDTLTDKEMAKLDLDAITAMVGQLLDHLMAARVVDPDELDEEPGLDVRWIDKKAGLVAVGVWIEGLLYTEYGGVLYAERGAHGGIEWAIVSDDDGSVGSWHREAPSLSRSKQN